MPRLYFGSRGGVYYKRKGRKVYVTNSFGSNGLPEITRSQARQKDPFQVRYESTENPGAFHLEYFHEWYPEAIIDNEVPIETLKNPEVMIPWIRKSCISPLDFMTEDLWDTLIHTDINRKWDEFIKTDDGKIYWFLLWTIVVYLSDTHAPERTDTWKYIIKNISESISRVTQPIIEQKRKDEHDKLELDWIDVNYLFTKKMITALREKLESMNLITQI